MTPTDYRQGAPGIAIRYAVVACRLGYLLVAATERGVCAVSLGDSASELEAGLASEFPAAELHRDEAGLSPWVRAILAYLDGEQTRLDLPLDVHATAFQRLVWEVLRTIPYGETRTYGEIAAALGQPTAARAVARACATNPAALVIPCHRVVRQDGDPGGYRWGTDRKQTLLVQERAAAGTFEDGAGI
jgi:AraC family transcriptional regulator of adaptative response/methylated-DNA-[protein]-cysteine methyltransferase